MLGNDRFLAKRPRPAVGRPRGEIAEAVLEVLRKYGPLTAREVAGRLQLTINIAKFTCSRLHARGELTVADTVRVEGSRRPVRRYAVVSVSQGRARAHPRQLPAAFFSGRNT